MNDAAPDSRSLLALAQQGDADAFCELCRMYENRLLRQAVALCGDAALAEDLAQETLFEAWKCIRRYKGRCQFFTWLCAILLNRHRNLRRQRLPIALSALNSDDRDGAERALDNLIDRAMLPSEATMNAERSAFLWRCMQSLPAKHREVIYLRFYVDDSLDGIAEALGCSVGTIKSRLFHAIEKLRALNAMTRAHDRSARNLVEL